MAGEDREYIQFVRGMKCRMWLHDLCSRGIHAHHAGERGLGQRAHDHTAIPMCPIHHTAWHDCQIPFRGWPKEERRAWAARQIKFVRDTYAAQATGEFVAEPPY